MLLLYENWFIILMLIIFPPFGIIIMIKNSFWDKKIQIISGISSTILFFGMVFGIIIYKNNILNPNIKPNEHKQTVQNHEEKTHELSVTPTVTPNPIKTNPTEAPSKNVELNHEISITPVATINPVPKELIPEIQKDEKENYTLSEMQIKELPENEKYLYLLGREFYINNKAKYNLYLREVIDSKFDLTIEIKAPESKKISDELKKICEKIYHFGYKHKTMQIVLKIGKEIAIVNDYSSEILPQINCSVFENKQIIKKIINIDIEKKGEE